MRTTLLSALTTVFLLSATAHAAVQHQHAAPPAETTAAQAVTAPGAQTDNQTFKSPKDKISYAVGVDLIRNFKRQGIDADLAGVIRGMQEEKAGKGLALSEAELKKTLADYNLELKNKQALQKQLTAEQNKRDGKAFFLANKDKPGVVTLKSGLQYKVIKEGTGAKAGDNDGVTVRFRGTLLDGTEFDSTDFSGGYPVTFYVKDSVIDGWKEALKLMPAGSKWQIFVPSHLGYGEKGAGREIGPNVTLLYDIELIAVTPGMEPPKAKTEPGKKKTESAKTAAEPVKAKTDSSKK